MERFIDFILIVVGSMTGLILGSYLLRFIDRISMELERRKRIKSK